MHQPKIVKSERGAPRWRRPSLSPYVLDDVTFTLSEIREARVGSPLSTR